MGVVLCWVSQGASEGTPIPPSSTHEDDEEEVSQFSEGQLIPASSQSYSEDSEMSEESIAEGKNTCKTTVKVSHSSVDFTVCLRTNSMLLLHHVSKQPATQNLRGTITSMSALTAKQLSPL